MMECMKTLEISEVVFASDCSQLVKMVFTPTEWQVFSIHMEEFKVSKNFFPNFSIQLIQKTKINTMT